MHRAIFLDRDGVINEKKQGEFISSSEALHIIPGVSDAIRQFHSLGFKIFVVTNQPSIARGLCSEEVLANIHAKMLHDLGAAGKFIDAVYYCPHHPEKDHADIPSHTLKYRIDCDCRKPKPGMLIQAAKEHSIDLAASIMIGDHDRDIEAGKSAGCATIYVSETEKNPASNPDAVANNLLEAAGLVRKISHMPAVILVGGRGERLRPLTETTPKPMLPVGGRPLLEWLLLLAKKHGVANATICGHYLFDVVRTYFGTGDKMGMNISYIDDGPEPLGSGGALQNLRGKVDGDFFLLNGDVATTVNLTRLALTHVSNRALATLVVRETDHPHDSDIIQADEQWNAIRFFPKNENPKIGNLGNTGIFALHSDIFSAITSIPCNLENDILASLIRQRKPIRCHLGREYFQDMGTPERYKKVQTNYTPVV